jgi:CDP-diacylglycerol--glycerol-3-phosphate 3-phosphatidyltransferase/cardiolipin synthase
MLRAILRHLPNAVSLSRLALAVAFVAADEPLTRAVIVVLAALSDVLDGWIARTIGHASPSGALIDPLADRTFVIVAVSTLLFTGVLTTVQYFLLLARDIMTMVGFLVARIMPTLRGVAFQARPFGKAVTTLQVFTLLVALARPKWAGPFAYITGLVALLSITDYTLVLVRARRAVLRGDGASGEPSGPPPAAGTGA